MYYFIVDMYRQDLRSNILHFCQRHFYWNDVVDRMKFYIDHGIKYKGYKYRKAAENGCYGNNLLLQKTETGFEVIPTNNIKFSDHRSWQDYCNQANTEEVFYFNISIDRYPFATSVNWSTIEDQLETYIPTNNRYNNLLEAVANAEGWNQMVIQKTKNRFNAIYTPSYAIFRDPRSWDEYVDERNGLVIMKKKVRKFESAILSSDYEEARCM